MAKTIIPIPNQPLRFIDYHEAKFCQKSEPYCFLHQPDDPLKIQFKQQPCDENLLCNPDFDSGTSIGSELVLNGDFEEGGGNAAGWTLIGATYNSNNVIFNGSSDTVSQTIPVIIAHKYRLKFTITGYTTGTLFYFLAGTIDGITANGTYEFDIVSTLTNPTDLLQFGSDIAGIILDDVSVKEITDGGECWDSPDVTGNHWNI